MTFTLVPALDVQRRLYDRPRDEERFRAYLDELTGGGDELRLPLSNFNPMAREQAAAVVDQLIALDAETLATETLAEVNTQLKAKDLKSYRLALVVSDDVSGMWTDRATARFDTAAAPGYRDWLVATFWTSADAPTADGVRAEVRAAAYRAGYIERYGAAENLDQMLRQEALTETYAKVPLAPFDAVERARIEAALRPRLKQDDRPTLLPALLGDEAGDALGYAPLGLRDHDAIAVTRIDCRNTNPVDALLAGRR